ncbi:MAG: dephospho-CoA kinase [Planctomycetes bacterium]|nr:dephospho-CoA kinase [Planctomycetota bacterium]
MSPRRRRFAVIGLAGGIGSGKSAVAGIFKRLGAVIIDADEIAHRVLELPEIISAVVDEFGPEVIEDGAVSRPALAAAVFSSRERTDRLNAIVHPKVIEKCLRLIADKRSDPECLGVVLDAPLLFEAGLEELCDSVVFVDARDDVRRERLASSRGWTREELSRRENLQDSLISKRKRADYIIDNNGSLEKAVAEASAIWKSACGS